jgi:hypothetical protein
MPCDNNYYVKPYFWLLILTIILFLIFIAIVETNKSFTTTSMSPSRWVLLLFIIIFFVTSLLWYYYDQLKTCTVVLQPLIEKPYYSPEIIPIVNTINECSLDIVYDEPKISYIEDDYIPLSSLNPFV